MARLFEIHSERQRRIIIAVLMLALFLGSLSAAASFVAAHFARLEQEASRRDPTLDRDRAGDFSLRRPRAWTPMAPTTTDVETGEHVRELARWRERDGDNRRLGLLEVRHEHPMPPAIALDLVMSMGNGDSGTPRTRMALRSETMTGLMAERTGVREDGETVSQLLAALTLDGRRHAVLVLERSGGLRRYDLRLMVEMARSLADKRYSRVEGSAVNLSDGDPTPLPESLTAVEGPVDAEREQPEHDDDPRLVLIPSEEARFFFIQPRILPLSGEQAEARAAAANAAEQADDENGPPQLSADEWRVALTLAECYVQMTGEQPPPHSVRPMMLGERRGFSIALPDPGVGGSTSLWAVGVDDERVMLMQLTHDTASAPHVQAAARAFIAAYMPA